MPDARQVFTQLLKLLAVGLAQDQGLVGPPPFVILLDCFGGAQLLFPAALQRTRDQTVFRLRRVILAPCPFRLIAGPLAPQIREANVLFKWCINVSSVRAVIRANDFDASFSSSDGAAKSVTERRIDRRRPSDSRTTMKSGPRAEWDDKS